MSRVSRLLNVACLGGALGAALFTASYPAQGAERNPVHQAPQVASTVQPGRVIVKFKARAHALTAAAAKGAIYPQAASEMGARLHVAMADGRPLGTRTQVLLAPGLSSSDLAARLSQEADVEWAVVDAKKYAQYVPNDPLFPNNLVGATPTVGQWYLRAPGVPDNPADAVSAIDAEHAWDITRGTQDFVIADVDSGITQHPDLVNQVFAGSGVWVYGYDFVGYSSSDGAGGIPTANDGNGADPDPSDPGDWIDSQDQTQSYFPADQCPITDSTWHGTQTAGVLAAQTNNSTGMAGMVPNAKVLPVRVLGKCGGYDSDIIAGMQWAAGISVAGVPDNLHPAKVLNMSLGGQGSCDQAYQDVFDTLTSMNVVVVVAAGNDEGLALGAPANCVGAVAVAGLRQAGDKVGFSDIGSDVTISAPAGNCVNTDANLPCLYPILTASNTGTTSPVSSTYTDSFNASLGTSFSAPLVSGTVALMLSVSPNLTQPEVVSLLQSTATPFPTTGGSAGTVACVPPTSATQDECYCTTATCGAGMLNARAAVSQATMPFAVITGEDTATVGAAVPLSADSSVVAGGRTVASYQWQVTAGSSVASLSATTGPSVNLDGIAAGTATVQVTVTDSTGAATSTSQDVTFTSSGGGGGGGGGGGAVNPMWLLGLVLAGAMLTPRRREARPVRASDRPHDKA
jgi:serine protease